VGLVFGQHHRPLGQLGDGLPQGGEDLVAVTVAFGDQPGSPPAGDPADAPVQGRHAHGGAAEPLVQARDRPRPGFGQQPADALAKPWAAQPRPPRPGPVDQAHDPFVVVAMQPTADGERVVAEQAGNGSR
jgi:hypothetical protein